MSLSCRVRLLDGSESEFEISKSTKGSKLFDDVCDHIDVVEKDYFGLICKESQFQKCWLNLEKKVLKQVNKKEKLDFRLAVKFYPSDPALVKEEITRYQICLQIRQDLGVHLECSVDKLASLITYWQKSECDRSDISVETVKLCVMDIAKIHNEVSNPEFVDRVLSLCQINDGLSSADAEREFLLTAASLRLYGVHFYAGKEKSGSDILIGISSKGVVENRKGQIPVLHTWSRIKNIVHKNNKFKIKLLKAPPNGDPRLKKSFIFGSQDQVQLMWKNAVGHHIFYRVGDKDSDKRKKRKGSILRRLSSKKKSPKTETDVKEESESIQRPPPNVTRVGSLRKPKSVQDRVVQEMPSGGSESNPSNTEVTNSEDTRPKVTNPAIESLTSPVQADAAFTAALETPDDRGYEQVGDTLQERPEEKEREYTDDDLTDAILDSTRRESPAPLFAETIEEEEEMDALYAVSYPRKPIQYSPLQDDTEAASDKAESTEKPIETDLDVDTMLDPVGQDPPEFNENIHEYTEEWEDLQSTQAQAPKKDVRFVTDEASDDEKFLHERERPSVSTSGTEEDDTTDGKTNDARCDVEEAVPSDDPFELTLDPIPAPENREEDAEEFKTIREYVPKARKESTEESEDYASSVEMQSNCNGKSDTNESADEDDAHVTAYRKTAPAEETPSSKNMEENNTSTGGGNGSSDPKSSQGSPILSGKRDTPYRTSGRNLGIDFRVGDVYKLKKAIDGAASTTAATIGDEEDLAMQELDEDILYGEQYADNDDDAKVSDHSEDENAQIQSEDVTLQQSPAFPPAEDTSKYDVVHKPHQDRIHDGGASTTAATIGEDDDLSIEELDEEIMDDENSGKVHDIILDMDDKVIPREKKPEFDLSSCTSIASLASDDTDELLVTNALEKAWSEGAQLDEDDDLFQVLFRSPPKKRNLRNRSEIDLSEVNRGKHQAMAFRNIIDEEPSSPRRKENLAKRPFIPSWPFDPLSLISSKDLDELEIKAVEAALIAQKTLLDEESRLVDMEMMGDDRAVLPDDSGIQSRQRRNELRDPFSEMRRQVKTRSRSPSASPRMVGEEFIPGVPDFVHSVLPYQLATPVVTAELGDDTVPSQYNEDDASVPNNERKCVPEFRFTADETSTPPDSTKVLLEVQRESVTPVPESATPKLFNVEPDVSDQAKPTASSGRSSPNESTSQSEGTSSSNSKSSASSFPRFVHSVFPLRRASDERRGRSKTRRKREKKVTKQRNKKIARSKSRDKKATKPVPSIEVTDTPVVQGFEAFPISSTPHYPQLQEAFNKAKGRKGSTDLSNVHHKYDQESLDKITLSDSDDAHSKQKAPE